jgi:hypothetical protein
MNVNLEQLAATAVIRDEPPPASNVGRGRPPLYLPLLQRILDAHGRTVHFGPIATKADAERVRAGMSAYAADHPELIPDGFVAVRFTVRAEDGGWSIYGWCEEKG